MCFTTSQIPLDIVSNSYGRQPTELQCKHDNQDHPEPEDWNRDPDQREDGNAQIQESIVFSRRKNTCRNSYYRRSNEEALTLKRGRKSLDNQRENVLLIYERLS